MHFNIEEALEVLSRTPAALNALLAGLSSVWIDSRETSETWSPYDIMGHLLHAEQSNWMLRVNSILKFEESRAFEPFDRLGFREKSHSQTLNELLEAFAKLRNENIDILRNAKFSSSDLEKTGVHPEFGRVKLRELLATWVVHDLSHIRQITQTMARQYQTEVGPWKAYLSILKP